MYRKRIKGSKKYNAMRAARLRQIGEGPAPDAPLPIPDLRRRVTIEDFDFGYVREVIELHKSNRIDSYEMIVDGTVIKRTNSERIGWSRVVEKIRMAFLRVHAV